MKVTVPVAELLATVAVSVMLLPGAGEAIDDVRAVVVAVRADTTTVPEVLVAYVEFPP